jgi:RHS repeat-associated protein
MSVRDKKDMGDKVMRVLKSLRSFFAWPAVVLLAALGLTPPAHAQCNPQLACCQIHNPGGSPACGSSSATPAPASPAVPSVGAGNPINLLTGNKYQHEVDLPALPGVLGLTLSRHYNSALSTQVPQTGSHPGAVTSVLGRGWRLNLEARLHIGSDRITLHAPDGGVQVFARSFVQRSRYLAAVGSAGSSTIDVAEASDAAGRYLLRPDGLGPFSGQPGEQQRFDAAGRLIQVQAATGEFMSLTYAPDGQLAQVTDPQGRSLRFATANEKQLAVDTPTGRITYERDERGVLTQVLLPSAPNQPARVRRYHHDNARPGLLTGISAGLQGQTLQRLGSYAYDAQGRGVLSVKGWPKDSTEGAKDERGIEQIELRYEPNLTQLTNSVGASTTYRHALIAGQQRLLEVRGAGCAACTEPDWRYTYDAQGRQSEAAKLDAQGRVLYTERTVYDAQGRAIELQRQAPGQPAAVQVRYGYTDPRPIAAFLPTLIARPSVAPSKELTTRIDYNEHGQPTSISEEGFSPIDDKGQATATPITRTTSYTYSRINGRSVLTSIDGPLPNGPKATPEDSDITRIEWDQRASVVTAITQPGGFKSQAQYDDASRITQVRNDEGQSSRFEYGPSGQLAQLRRQGPGGFTQTQTFTYDAHGNPTEARTDSHGQPISATAQGFDIAGRALWRATALGTLEQTRYDSESRVIDTLRTTNAITQRMRYHYAPDGQLAGTSDNAGRHTSVLFDKASGRAAAVVDSLGRVQALGPRRAALSPRQLIDDFGRNVLTKSPDSGITTRRFDQADRLIGMTDALGNEARYEHDTQGRIVKQSAKAANAEPVITRWRYEGQRLVQLDHPTQGERYEYDANGWRVARIVTVPTANGQITAITRYEYDAQGRLIASTLPDGSRLVHERNGQGQVTALKRSQIITPWLQRFETPQLIVKHLERDLIGLRRSVAGNGVETLSLRSKEGTLARTVHRAPVKAPKPMTALRDDKPWREQVSDATVLAFEALMGVRSAHPTPTPTPTPTAPSQPVRAEPALRQAQDERNTAPGALNHPDDPQAVIDHRYLWDAAGNLRLDQQRTAAQETAYAYDAQDRLIVAQTQAAQAVQRQPVSTDAAQPQPTLHRYFHDAQGRRVLAQEGQAETHKTAYQTDTHRAITGDAQYDATGQPLQQGQRRYTWDAHGRLIKVSEGSQSSEYAYDHRGLRNTKTTHGNTTHTLHDESHQLIAELDAQGRLTRQYVYLADMPVAVIDSEGAALAVTSKLQVLQDLAVIVKGWLGNSDKNITWLHLNHLGASEAATDAKAQVVWQASYAPYGKPSIKSTGFTLNLRLPGQYEDAETGLHYNRQRYYDPNQGRYLTPDPLGTPDGPNGYAYVAYNPLRYVDPDGLVLFAFDGTGNDLSDEGAISNVARFRRLYQGGGEARYVAGVGTVHNDRQWGDIEPPGPDMGTNGSGTRRIERMMTYLMEEARTADDYTPMDIDIVGFSRGAAQARDFANNILSYFATSANGDSFSFSTDARGWFNYSAAVRNAAGQRVEFRGRQCVRFRFMGLWDTVLSANTGRGYNMAIPAQFQHVAHAVALNEHRSDDAEWNATRRNLPLSGLGSLLPVGAHWGGFPLVSIGASSDTPGQVRIERGFVGAHADIGGGYAGGENQLSFVALSWMVAQARSAGLQMRAPDADSAIPTANPIIHDQSNALRVGSPVDNQGNAQRFVVRDGRALNTYTVEDRQVSGAASGSQQRNMGFTNYGPNNRSMTFADTQRFISYLDRNLNGADNSAQTWIDRGPRQINGGTNQTGTVNIAEYMRWLRSNGYCFAGGACDRVRQ